uniref:Uncharacterized protein n=1 Tax=Tanacetum cinerariifolium TaxID=118510 RepID=A0A699U5J8_TANCI|nr:hypothetical protein [Tanacetum cinerariifolium]
MMTPMIQCVVRSPFCSTSSKFRDTRTYHGVAFQAEEEVVTFSRPKELWPETHLVSGSGPDWPGPRGRDRARGPKRSAGPLTVARAAGCGPRGPKTAGPQDRRAETI